MHDASPGWDAIDDALARLYPGQEPVNHLAPRIPYALGGQHPLDGISIYDASDHWHFVTYGMSELYDKESGNHALSGWGIEFTFRLRKLADAPPPSWAANFLQNLARYVYNTGNTFEPGHTMTLNGPIAVGEDTAIGAIVMTEDPMLPAIDTPHGSVVFLQIVGITEAERHAFSAWRSDAMLALAMQRWPPLVTDLHRRSWLEDTDFEAAWQDGRARDGSSNATDFVGQLGWDLSAGPVLRISAVAIPSLTIALPGRLLFGRPYTLQSRSGTVHFHPSPEGTSVEESAENTLILSLPESVVRAIGSGLQPRADRYRFDGITIEVLRTEIRDADGTVTKTIG